MLSKRAKDLIKLAKNPKFISGIYNYCDRWCEKCPMTSKCLLYAQEKEEMSDTDVNDMENEKFWEKIHTNFEMVREMIEEDAKRLGIDLDLNDPELEEISKKEELKEKEAENHELSGAAMKYSEMVDVWFKNEKKLFEQKSDELITNVKIGLDEKKVLTEATEIADATEVIRWYQHQIFVKLMRGLTNDDDLFDDFEEDLIQNDANGSVKVALLGIDRSIGAFETLRNYFTEKNDSLLDFLIHLDRLRRKTEQHFPNARKFIRAGFDDDSDKGILEVGKKK
ncbi:MAG: hypothetical protein FVQ77_04040 [Cytophagales bacterium]|nr:hypothetical protein [Cytophagales bacterium]